ncbi:hypothetical protein IMZ08_13300 [Bacillus luteolus]|uniref:Uncharacterized protein n=1 Tax=Litchfieldia luteola TaxID=682179 RepID=A0ABR9QKR7_9BACI|nr:hypothetical protein [Cytobacillus luteolus]MBE4909039.1 hypothetical protein [Cytobacillus luteolus]MBP1941897.1 hypothetical protein [Cytobacillus luteolus]
MLIKISKVLMIVSILFGFKTLNTKAVEIQDIDNPISFTVEVLPWELVNTIIPYKSVFTIIDVETGMQFQVQRRAGRSHADVQPLTRKDTKIMKEIYSGKWSWKRRAIFVLKDDNILAASMHGMPHGAGAIQNGFPGHFCVHFIDSTTHRSKLANRAHKLMILKAAGQLEDYVLRSNPYELIHIFSEGIVQRDKKILALTVQRGSVDKLFRDTSDIEQIKVKIDKELSKETLSNMSFLRVPVEMKMYVSGKGKVSLHTEFQLERESTTGPWTINGKDIYQKLGVSNEEE